MDFNRESFVFHIDWYNALSKLDKEIRLEVYDAIMRKAFFNEPPYLSDLGNLAMSFIEPQIERDTDKWLDIRGKRSNAGKAHKGNQYTKMEQMEHNETNGTSVPSVPTLEQNGTNGTVSVSVDNNSVIYKEEKDSKEKEIEEFVEYIYKLYPTKCPVRMISTGKSVKDKKRIEGLLKRYSMEDIERVVKKEVEDKLGKHPLKNFSTFLNNFPDPNDMFTKTGYGYPQSVADVKPDDINNTLIQFQYWLDRAAPTLCDNLRGGWPETEQQYQNMIKSTVGGATALSYVVLVFNRDGWDEYYDERGFMWTYLNYIKANGLYEG